MDQGTLRQRQSLPLDAKIRMTQARIRAWYDYWDGDICLSYSGGKDSRVLADILWGMYPEVRAFFSNTWLEYPEVVQLVKDDIAGGKPITIVRPKKTFLEVIKNYGFPVVSKKVARMLRILKHHKGDPNWANTYRLYDTGIKQDGSFSRVSRLPAKWRPIVDADFKVTELCCDFLKKEPMDTIAKEFGLKRMTAIMSAEGGLREKRKHCNVFDTNDPNSAPMLFWTEQDVLRYIKTRNLPIPSVYGEIVEDANGLLSLTGEVRTGCMWCMFGVHLERGENRFQRMARTHPKQYDYCINRLGMGQILDLLGVDYKPKPKLEQSLVQISAAGRD